VSLPPFLDLPEAVAEMADCLLLPLPYEATVSYGGGTARAPAAIWRASCQVEVWDEEIGFDLGRLRYHTADAVVPVAGETPPAYLARVEVAARTLHPHRGLVVGVGGEHGLTPALVAAARPGGLVGVTVVQLDAHADLRATYGGWAESHACAMHRLVEAGAEVVAIGIRSASAEEAAYGRACGRVTTYGAQELAEEAGVEARLLDHLGSLTGAVYLTLDIDGLEVHLCPATGTPQPGGLGWWQTLRYLRRLLVNNRAIHLLGADLVETVPAAGGAVNEMVAARLLAKVIAYHGAAREQ